MSPVAPVFHSVVTVIIGLKTNIFNSSGIESFGEQDQLKAQFQIEATDPYPPNKWRKGLGTLVVLSNHHTLLHLFNVMMSNNRLK